ncbi:MAG: glycosyltransferase family 39 protein, partial [Candidatus Omnitrophica bacterium]|nr:glycosyltransferase family 39 protein [Candidatus Omnitrophota bacterium]
MSRRKGGRKDPASTRADLSVAEGFIGSEAPWKIKSILILLLLAAVAVSYGNSIYGVFVFDDHTQILNNPYIKSIKNIPAIFLSGFSHLNITGVNYYRPILEVSYLWDRFLYGTWVVGYHITSILIHMLSTVVLFLLIQRIFRKIKISFLTALLFGVHPIYTSAVTYISGRGDSIVILFILSSLLFYVKYLQFPRKKLKYLIPAVLSLFLALLTKETALFFVVVLFLYRYCHSQDPGHPIDASRWRAVYISAITAVVIYLFMRSAAIANIVTLQYNVAASSDWHVRFFTSIRAFLNYLILLAFPVGLHL